MPLDPNIILQAGQINDPNQMLALKMNMQKMQLQDQQLQTQNALKRMLADPASYANGQLTAPAKQAIFAADPKLGLEIQREDYNQQVLTAQARAQKTKEGAAKFGFMTELAGIGVSAYDEAKKSGKSEEDARAAAIQARNDAAEAVRKTGSGLITDEDYSGISSQPFDPDKATALASANKEWAAARAKAKTEDLGERRLIETERHNAENEKAAGRREDRMISAMERKSDPTDTKWEVRADTSNLDDKGNPIQYRYNAQTGQATTLDAKQPYTPGSAAKVGAATSHDGFTPQMSELMGALAEEGVSLPTGFRSKEQQISLYKGILDRNPGKSPGEIARMLKTGQIEFGAQKKETQTAAGIAGKVQVFANELAENIPLLREAARAVPRGEWTDLNKLLQTADEHISDPKLKTLKGYINSTIQAYDGLSARGGTDVEKRAQNRKLLLSADGPEAFEAQLGVFEKESEIAKKAAYAATKSPELPNVPGKEGGGGKGGGKDETSVTPDFYVPDPLKKIKTLQWSKSRQQFRDSDTGKVYDMKGSEVPGG